MLSSLRLTGAVFLDGEFRAPWAVLSHLGPDDCAQFFAEPHHVIAYHFVRSGWLTCEVDDQPPVKVSAGEIVLLPRNDPHILRGPDPCTPVDSRELMGPAGADGLFHVRAGGDGGATEIYCGYLGTRAEDDPLLRSLPAIITVSLEAARDQWIVKAITFAAESLSVHSPEMVGKLAEGLFSAAVRRYIEALPPRDSGLVAGLRDSAVGRALALIHARYSEAWTLDLLAREAGVSKTVLNDRFRALLGEAPMQYCGRWRMRAAANMLRDDRRSACDVAYSVGFNSEAAFSRAFKREFGVPPGEWSRAQRAAQG